MPSTTEDILKAAADLGKLIAEHDAVKKVESVEKKLADDIDSQRLIADYSRCLQSLGEKEQSGQPIEVADKRKLEDLQRAMTSNLLLAQMQTAQMDYLDLMRQVDAVITPAALAPPSAPAGPQ